MEPHPDLIRFAEQYRGSPSHLRRQSNGPYSPDLPIEVYSERVHKGKLQVLTFYLDSVVWINLCPQMNPVIHSQAI